MNKQEFLKQLQEAFTKYEIPASKSDKYFKKFEKLINNIEEKDLEAKIEELGTPDDIAKKFKELIEEKDSKAKEEKKNEPASPAIEENGETRENEVVSLRGKYIFIGGVVLSSPIWLTLSIILIGFFGVIYAAMIAIDVAIAVFLSFFIIVGGIASFSAIIYGVIGLLPGAVASYIGMYELGLGLMILGTLIVVSILLHFFVVKVTPLVFRQTTRFFKFLVKKIIKLVKFLRKECDKI